MAAMDVSLVKEIQLKEGTQHTIISDQEELDGWPQEVTWITCVEKSEVQLLDTIQAIVRWDTPQRVSIPGLQMFCGVLHVDAICRLVDTIIKCFAGTKHQVIIPTVRFVPAAFMWWEQTFALNKYIWAQAVAHGCGVLNLHRNFMARQSRSWVVHGPCYAEFCEDTGLGATLSSEGMKRYEARLLRLHSGGFDREYPPAVPLNDQMPLVLWSTAGYCNSRSCSELLESLGYKMAIPKRERAGRKAAEQAQTVKGAKVSRGSKRGRSLSVGPEQEPVGPSRASRGRGRGRVSPRDSSGNIISTFQLEEGTVRSMIRQISDLKLLVQVRDDEIQRARKEQEALKKDLELARDDVRRKESMISVFEARSRADSRSLRREREAQYDESKEWQRQRQEWREERKDMLDMYETLHAKHYQLRGQFEVFRELGAGGDKAEKKARKEKK